MKIILKLLFLWTLLLTENTYAQIKPLKIGDKIPDLILNRIIGKKGPVSLKNLRNQELLIINFWATWCIPCIKELPVLDSLVAINAGRLKVLSVEYEDEAIVKTFLKRHPDINTHHLMVLTNDKILIEYFKHRVIPHNIWIDANGIIKNITGSEEISKENVEKFINQGKLKAHDKVDHIAFDMHETFHMRDSSFIYRSILTGFQDGINGGSSFRGIWHHPTERWIQRLFAFNQTKADLLWMAINRRISSNDYYHLMKIETKDSLRFFWPSQCRQTFSKSKYKSKQEFRPENLYCYELNLPKGVQDTDFFNCVLNDLERSFEIKITTEKRTIPCSLIGLDTSRHFPIPNNDSSYINISASSLKVHNVSVFRLFEFLNENVKPDANATPLDPPYIDQTEIGHRIDLEVKFDIEKPNYAEIKKEISKKYGFNFKNHPHLYNVTIVKDLVP